VLQLDLFLSDARTYRDALARYETIRPLLRQERTLAQHSRITGLSYWQLWRDLQRFQRAGVMGLLDRRTLPHPRGRPPIETRLPQHIQQHLVRLALAHPFTARELAWIVQECDHEPIDYRGIQHVLTRHQLSPAALQRHHEAVPHAAPLASPPAQPSVRPVAPSTQAQRLALALAPEPLLLRLRTDDEYPTAAQARWRIIERLEVGFRPRRVATRLAIQPAVVYHCKRRFAALGLLGLTTQRRVGTPITTRLSVQVIMEVLQLLDNNPLLGHDRVKMALDSLGYRDGHTTVWQRVALDKQAHPPLPRQARLPNPDERPQQATVPHQVWCVDVRYLVEIDGRWRSSILIFDGDSRAIVGAGCFDRQTFSQVVQVCRQAIEPWGAPEAVVSDHGAVFVALQPCLEQLAIQWTPITKGHPWQNLAESGFAIQRRMLDAYVVGCTERAMGYRQHAQFVHDYQFWGHWAHKRRDAQGRVYYLAPEVVLGNTKGRTVDPGRLRRIFRLRQVTRTVRRHGQIRLHNFGLYIDQGCWGQTVEVLIYDEVLRFERADHLLVVYPCVYDPRQRRVTAADAEGRQQYHYVQAMQLLLWTFELIRSVWRMPRYRRKPRHQGAHSARQMGLFESFAE
jgi:transposase InsO family protein